MTLTLIILAVLCIVAYACFCFMATKEHSTKTIVVKLIGSAFFLASGIVLLIKHFGDNKLFILLPIALLLGLVGDGFIEKMEVIQATTKEDGLNAFTFGGITFELEHILLIVFMIILTPSIFPFCLIGIAVILGIFAIMYKPMQINAGKLLLMGSGYIGTIGLMVGSTVMTLIMNPSVNTVHLAFGGLLFVISDLVLVVNYFGKYRTKANIFIINLTYAAAQILICNMLFLI